MQPGIKEEEKEEGRLKKLKPKLKTKVKVKVKDTRLKDIKVNLIIYSVPLTSRKTRYF